MVGPSSAFVCYAMMPGIQKAKVQKGIFITKCVPYRSFCLQGVLSADNGLSEVDSARRVPCETRPGAG